MATALTTIWREIAQQVGLSLQVQSSIAAIGPDPGRWLISTALRQAGADPQRFDGCYAYVLAGVNINEQRGISGYLPDLGALRFDGVMASVFADGDTLDVAGPLPFIKGRDGRPGLREAANLALRDLWTPDTISLTSQANQVEYAVPTWLNREDRLVVVKEPGFVSWQQPVPTRRRYRLRIDGPTPYLQLLSPFRRSGVPFYLETRRPADTLISDADSTTGLVSGSDTAAPELADIVTGGLFHAYRMLAAVATDEKQRDHWQQLAALQEPKFRALERYLPRDTAQTAGAAA